MSQDPGQVGRPSRRRKALPPLLPPNASFGLTDCQRLLAREFGAAAPSIATLYRHAAAGDLKRAETSPERKPPRYVWTKIRSHYQPRAVAPAPLPTSAPAAATGLTQEQLAAALATALQPLLQPVLEELASVRKELAGMAAVRQALMLKYDAAAASALNRADSLAEQLRASRQLLDLDGRMGKMTVEFSRLASRLENLAPLKTAGD
jgi:hypothetical protein